MEHIMMLNLLFNNDNCIIELKHGDEYYTDIINNSWNYKKNNNEILFIDKHSYIKIENGWRSTINNKFKILAKVSINYDLKQLYINNNLRDDLYNFYYTIIKLKTLPEFNMNIIKENKYLILLYTYNLLTVSQLTNVMIVFGKSPRYQFNEFINIIIDSIIIENQNNNLYINNICLDSEISTNMIELKNTLKIIHKFDIQNNIVSHYNDDIKIALKH